MALNWIGALLSGVGTVAGFFTIKYAIMCGIAITVHGRWHRLTKRYFWLSVTLAFVAAIAFINAGGRY